jgi:hypothetical protein
MITDADVVALYECLLGRAPESADTVAAFKAYYPDFASGRRAILNSAEFARLFAGETRCSVGLLAGGLIGAGVKLPPVAADGETAGLLRDMLRRHGKIRLAVVAGEEFGPLTELLPLEDGAALVVHAAARGAEGAALARGFPGAAALFVTGDDAESVAALVEQSALRVDFLAACEEAWFTALRPHLAEQAILVTRGDFPASMDEWDGLERVLRVGALSVRHRGGWFLPVRYAPRAAETIPGEGVRLAIAAIVRNEQEAVVNMLASAAGIAHCFVVLDTGSMDETAARAAAFLQSTGKPWTLRRLEVERFDDMRNAALDLVPSDADWVLMLDADEELVPEDFAALAALLLDAQFDAYSLPRYNYLVPEKAGEVMPYPDRQVRLLRNGAEPRLRYEGAVHETVRGMPIGLLPLDAGALGQGTGGPHIHHMVRRYRSAPAEAEKQARYLEIAVRYGER